MKPANYNEIIQTVELCGFRLITSNSHLTESGLKPELKVKIDFDSEFAPSSEDGEYAVTTQCRMTLFEKEEEKCALSLTATYLLRFKSSKQWNDEFFKMFKDTSVRLIVWPFFRDYVHSQMGRMNLPSFLLPIGVVPVLPAMQSEE